MPTAPPTCSAEGCDRDAVTKGMCRMHYDREWKRRTRAAYRKTLRYVCLCCDQEFTPSRAGVKYCDDKECRDVAALSKGTLAPGTVLHPPRTDKRLCLKCEQPFLSWGNGNRMCRKCARENRHIRELPPNRRACVRSLGRDDIDALESRGVRTDGE